MKTIDYFRKDIAWPPLERSDSQRRKLVVQSLVDRFHDSNEPELPRSIWNSLTFIRHQTEGAQMWVSKQVSDDLLASKMDTPEFSDLQWPADSLEFYFEDPALCSLLVVDNTLPSLSRWVEKILDSNLKKLNEFKPLISILLQDVGCKSSNMVISASSVKPEELKLYCEEHLPIPAVGEAMSNEEEEALRFMTTLCLKVMVLASIPKFKPRATLEQPTKKEGGKAGYLHRAKLPRFVVRYLPEHLAERAAHAKKVRAEAAASGHTFRGRNGHIRKYKDDRYVNMKGQQQFIFPVPGPDGTVPMRKFKVV
jgi:hypothetical protein